MVLVYLPVLRHAQFVWDDDTAMGQNGLLAARDGWWRLWLTRQAVDYWPVTGTSFWLEWRLWGAHAAGYHATDVLLHALGALLLWRVLRRAALPGAYAAALVFALHPLNVESVAWIAERKNELALIFYLLAIDAFLVPRLGLSLVWFALAMLSKGSVATLPFVLLGLIVWRRRPTAADWRGLIPFAAIAALLTAVNIGWQARNAAGAIRSATALERILGAGAALWFYLGKALLPIHLSFVYPAWHLPPSDLRGWLPFVAAILATAGLLWACLAAARAAAPGRPGPRPGLPSIARPLLFAWLYFCVCLVPVLGLTDAYFMRYSLVADHYAELALIAIAALAGWGWARLRERTVFAWALGIPILLGLAGLTWRQGRIYRDSETLFRATLERNPDCWLAHNNLGIILRNRGDAAEATHHFEQAIALKPDYADPHHNLGLMLIAAGRYANAVAEFQRAEVIDPRLEAPREAEATAHYGWGLQLSQSGQGAAAIPHFARAVRLKPDFAEAANTLATQLYRAGRLPEAEATLEQLIRIRPDYWEGHYNLGIALSALGRTAEAQAQFAAAEQLKGVHP